MDPVQMLAPMSTVLNSSEEPSMCSESESTFSSVPRKLSDEESLSVLMSRFGELHERVAGFASEGESKTTRPSKRQRRSAHRKSEVFRNGAGFEGSHVLFPRA